MLEKIFDLKANGTSVRQELRAGLTSFMAMCYLIFVVPSMLADAGMPRESAVAAVIWVTIAITLLMGLWARFPVGVAPGLGITAFFAYYVCGPAGYSWQTGLGAVFISGVFFMLLTVTRVRQMIIDAVPMDLKYAIVVGIGAFIAFIGLKNCGIVVADPSTFVTLGPLTKPEALLALGGLALMAMLMCLRVPGSMIIGILTVTVAGVLCGVTAMPEQAFSGFSLPLPTETFMQMDLKGALHHGLISIIFTLTMVDLFDNMGVLIGLEEWRTDVTMMALHLQYLRKHYWKTRYSVNFPRMRPSEGHFQPNVVMSDRELAQLTFAFRIFDHDVDISFSTRERAEFRNHIATLGATSMSAGSKTDPGGYRVYPTSLEQFVVSDERTPAQVEADIRREGYEVVWKDWDKIFD